MRALVSLCLCLACSGAPDAPVVEEPSTEAAPPASVAPPPIITPDVEVSEPRYAATHVLISWSGATRSTATRTEAEAEALARDLHQRAADGAALDELAREHSDGPSRARGGGVGVYAAGTMAPEFERAVASVDPGQLGPLVRSEFGFHIVRRDPVVEARIAQIQVSLVDPSTGVRRSDQDVADRVAAIQQALGDGRPWQDVARDLSDHPSGAERGGEIGIVAPGQLPRTFEAAALALEPGQISDPVTTATGVHLLKRLP